MGLEKAFDSENFRALGHAAVDLVADYFQNVLLRKGKVIEWKDPATQVKNWNLALSKEGGGDALTLLRALISDSMHLHHPRFMGHQQGVSLPLSALCDFITSSLSNSNGIYEMGPVGTVIERRVIEWMGEKLGFSKTMGGFFTSGGTMGNLTALLAARRQKADDVWNKGTPTPLAILVSGNAHYSIDRAVRIMGWGKEGAIKISVDRQYRMRPECLDEGKREAERLGRKVIAVVASSCNTATGTFDPIEPLADFCAQNNLWLHVDGAHGASTVLSDKYRNLVSGIERADSVTWDAHKMLMMSALSTGIIFKNENFSYETFSQEASYILEKNDEKKWYNLCARTLETTKRDSVFRLFASLHVHGSSTFEEYVTKTYDLSRIFSHIIKESGDFELAAEPESNIVCFRFNRGDVSKIRKQIIEEGNFYLVQTQLPTGAYLRTTLMNPFTSQNDLLALLDAVRSVA